MRNKVYSHVLRHVPRGARILELNAGTGTDAVELAQRGYFVHATDIAPGMLNRLPEKLEKLGLQDRVTLMTDFLPDRESLAALGDSDLIVFPYQSTGESSSAAVRYGLATGRPVALTPLPIFDDVRRAVYELPGQAPG